MVLEGSAGPKGGYILKMLIRFFGNSRHVPNGFCDGPNGFYDSVFGPVAGSPFSPSISISARRGRRGGPPRRVGSREGGRGDSGCVLRGESRLAKWGGKQ